MSCHVSELLSLFWNYTRVWARGYRWVVSGRAINIGTFDLNIWKKITFSFTPEIFLRWWEDDARNCSRHWNGIVLEDIFHIETWITAPDHFLHNFGHNKDAGKMAKLFADAILLIVSLLNIFTVGKCY